MWLKYDFNAIYNELKQFVVGNVALVDRYGLVLASDMPGCPTAGLISPTIWEAMKSRQQIAKELNVQKIGQLILVTDQGNLIITFGNQIYLFVLLPATAELKEILPILEKYMSNLEQISEQPTIPTFSKLDIHEDIEKIREVEKNPLFKQEKFPIFKHLVKYMTAK
jgi:predicted regulator of Ras-like GTPase activity (Roadblock/LC7/MglB family)